jgi:hypothetical protein
VNRLQEQPLTTILKRPRSPCSSLRSLNSKALFVYVSEQMIQRNGNVGSLNVRLQKTPEVFQPARMNAPSAFQRRGPRPEEGYYSGASPSYDVKAAVNTLALGSTSSRTWTCSACFFWLPRTVARLYRHVRGHQQPRLVLAVCSGDLLFLNPVVRVLGFPPMKVLPTSTQNQWLRQVYDYPNLGIRGNTIVVLNTPYDP